MKSIKPTFRTINTVKELHALMGLPAPLNPLITVIDHATENREMVSGNDKLLLNFYNITIKKSFKGTLKYGKNEYDFDEGSMSFIAPNQVISIDPAEERNKIGWSLLFHPDLIQNYNLAKIIKNYNFFSYSSNEALHLSDDENAVVEMIVNNIASEINSRVDHFSQDLIVSNLDLLLNYCQRFYDRQFLTRKMIKSDFLSQFESILSMHFQENRQLKLPTVDSLAQEMNVSSAYLSDHLRILTGQNCQQHIHEKLIEKAKEILLSTDFTIAEIAYQLGFEYPQSFSKLFKNKTKFTPIEFRKSYLNN